MDLLGGDYIVSNLPLDEAWERTIKSIEESSSDEFKWQVYPSKQRMRLTATMEYQKKFRLKRNLMLEINFFPAGERVRLELHYTIQPMLNILESEGILRQTVEKISSALGGDEGVSATYSASSTLPPELKDVATPAEGNFTAINWIEVLLAVNVFFLFIGAFTGHLSAAVQTLVFWQILLAIPIGIVVLIYRGFSNMFAEKKSFKEQSMYQRILVGVASIAAGVFVCLAMAPIILFGLCIGFLFTLNIKY